MTLEALDSFKDLLESTGKNKVFIAQNEAQAMECIKANKIDVILLEPVMKQTDLIDTTTEVDPYLIGQTGFIVMKNIQKVSQAKFILRTTQLPNSLVKFGFPRNMPYLVKTKLYKETLREIAKC